MAYTNYPPIYHSALNHLIEYGPWVDSTVGRQKCADALKAIRAKYGRERAIRERDHMRQICGIFPVK
jgi:hypothetical protein